MQIRTATSEGDLEAVRALFREYVSWIGHDLGIDLGYQGVERELATLPGAFAPPRGCLLLAEDGGLPIGCIAMRPLADRACEMKRMYVRPVSRSRGIGKALCNAIVRAARDAGYQTMRLDTEVSMTAAQRIYESLGFVRIAQYYPVPPEMLKRTIFMELSLHQACPE